jgi:hypothetical protein
MSEKIDLGGIKVPAKDWKLTPEIIKPVLMQYCSVNPEAVL